MEPQTRSETNCWPVPLSCVRRVAHFPAWGPKRFPFLSIHADFTSSRRGVNSLPCKFHVFLSCFLLKLLSHPSETFGLGTANVQPLSGLEKPEETNIPVYAIFVYYAGPQSRVLELRCISLLPLEFGRRNCLQRGCFLRSLGDIVRNRKGILTSGKNLHFKR